ncbi:hypothetical protein [Segatella bryantii]|uniref:hypothetical protein n=1 Tax=Segatella bryantii TaxID=77095 RepID=UPI00243067FF|nr:hypothetical protein [Segatella bryantii]
MLQYNGIIWVQGENGANNYNLAPNSLMPLWDSERQTIYLKSTDFMGRPITQILDYTIRDSNQPDNKPSDKPNYATTDDINSLKNEIELLKKQLERSSKINESNIRANGKQKYHKHESTKQSN